MKRKIKRTLLKVVSAVLVLSFVVYDFAWAMPEAGEINANILAQGTLFTADKDAFQKVFTGWVERGGLDMFDDNSIVAAEKFLREIDGRVGKDAPENADILQDIPNAARHGQFFIVNGDDVIRCYDPNTTPAFPVYNFKTIWDFSLNRYLRFQMLKRLDKFDQLNKAFGVFNHEINNVLMGAILWLEHADHKITLNLIESSEQLMHLIGLGKELDKCKINFSKKYQNLQVEKGEYKGVDREGKDTALIMLLKEYLSDLQKIKIEFEGNDFSDINGENKRLTEQFLRTLKFSTIKISAFINNRGEFDVEGVKRNVNIDKSLQAAAEYFWGKRKEVEFDLNDVPQVNIDEGLLLEVWMNLFKNAFQTMKKNGKVYVHSGFDQKHNEVIVSVKDEGPGISEDIQDKVFQKFFTTRGDRGNGIGLWLCKEIIENSGGTIDFQTVMGEGTTFIVRLPAVKEDIKRPNLPKGHVINGFDFIVNEFKNGMFTRKDFFEKQKMSEDTADKQIMVLRRLGILEQFGEHEDPFLRVRRSLSFSSDALKNNTENIMASLYSDPNDDEIAKARIEIDALILEKGIKEVVETIKATFEGRDSAEVIDQILLYWPERALTQGEKTNIEGSLSRDETAYFNWVMGLITRKRIRDDGKVLIGDLLDRLTLLVPDKPKYDNPPLQEKYRGSHVFKEKSLEDIVEIIRTLRVLPKEHKWISGIFFENWQLYFKIEENTNLTEEGKNDLFSEGEELFFKGLPDDLEIRLRDEYQDMRENGGYRIFPDFILELWPIGEDFGFEKEYEKDLELLEEVKREVYETMQKKKRSKSSDLIKLLRAYEYFLNDEMGNAKKKLELILDKKVNHKAAKKLFSQINIVLESARKMKIRQILRMWDLYFRQNKTIDMIRDETGVKEEAIKSKLPRFKAEFHESVSYENRVRMIRDGVEEIYIMFGSSEYSISQKSSEVKYASIFIKDKKQEIDNNPKIPKYIRRELNDNSLNLNIDNAGYVEFPSMFYETFGNIENVIFIEKPGTGVLRVQAAPGLFPAEKIYDAKNIRGKGDILQGFLAILENEEFLENYFTVNQFRDIRKKLGEKAFSRTTASNELKYMFTVGLLDKDDSGQAVKYALKNKVRNAKPQYISKIKFIISKFLPNPSDGQLVNAKKLIDGLDIPVSFKNPDWKIVKKESEQLLYYLNNLPKYNLKLIKLYTERRKLKTDKDMSGSLKNEKLQACLDSINVLKLLINEEFNKYPPAAYKLDITFERNYREEVRKKVDEALLLIDEEQEPAACAVLNSALSLIVQEYAMIVNAGEVKKRKKRIWYDYNKKKYIVPQGHYISKEISKGRSVYKKEKSEVEVDLLWQVARAMDKTLDSILLKLDWIRSVLPEINDLIERLEVYKEKTKQEKYGLGKHLDECKGKKSEVRKTLIKIGDEWKRTFVREKDIAAFSSQLAIELLNMDEFSSMLEILRTVRSMMKVRQTTLETQVYHISSGRLKDLRHEVKSRNNYFRSALKKMLIMTEQNVGTKALQKQFFTIVEDIRFKYGPEFFRMSGVLSGVKDKIFKKEDIDGIKRTVDKVEKRLALSDLLNLFMTDFRSLYVDGRIKGEDLEYFKKSFRTKFTQYLEYAKENNIGRGSPRLLWTWFYLGAHFEISMKLSDSKKDFIDRKNEPLFKAFQFLIRILEINDMHEISTFFQSRGYGNDKEFFGLKPKQKRKYDSFYDVLNKLHIKGYEEIDSVSTEEFMMIVQGIAKDFGLYEGDNTIRGKILEQMASEQEKTFGKMNVVVEPKTINEIQADRMESLDLILSDPEFRYKQFSRGDYYQARIGKLGKKGFRGRWFSTTLKEVDGLALLGVLDRVETQGPKAAEYKLNGIMRDLNDNMLGEIKALIKEAPESLHKKSDVTKMYRNRIKDVLLTAKFRLREERTRQIVNAKQMFLWKNEEPSKGDIVSAFDTIWGNSALKEKAFTRRDFQGSRTNKETLKKYSYTTITDELEGLVKLGILDTVYREGNAFRHKVNARYFRIPPSFVKVIRMHLKNLSERAARPKDELLLDYKQKLDISFDELMKHVEIIRDLVEIHGVDLSIDKILGKTVLQEEQIIPALEYLSRSEKNPTVREITIRETGLYIKRITPYFRKIVDFLETKTGLGEERPLSGFYISSSFARGWMKMRPKDMDIMVSFSMSRAGPSKKAQDSIIEFFDNMNRKISEEFGGFHFHLNYWPRGKEFEIKGNDIVETGYILEENSFREEDQLFRVIDIRNIKKNPNYRENDFLARVYENIARKYCDPAFDPYSKYVKTLSSDGVEMRLAGMDLTDFDNEIDLVKHLKKYCAVQNEVKLMDLFEKRIDDKHINKFETVFGGKNFLEKRSPIGENPLKIDHVRGVRGSEGVIKEMTNFVYDWKNPLQDLFHLMRMTRDVLAERIKKNSRELAAINKEGRVDEKDKEKEEMIGIFVDSKIGAGRMGSVIKAFRKLIRTDDPVLKILLSRIRILSVDMDPEEINDLQERYKFTKENMIFLCNTENKNALKEYEGDSIITLIDDKELPQEYYYPLPDLMYFSLALSGIFGHTHEDIQKIFRSIPNKVYDFSDKEMREMSLVNKVFMIKLGIPKAGAVTAESGIYEKIAKYIEAQA